MMMMMLAWLSMGGIFLQQQLCLLQHAQRLAGNRSVKLELVDAQRVIGLFAFDRLRIKNTTGPKRKAKENDEKCANNSSVAASLRDP